MAFIDTPAGYGGDIWGANGGGAQPGGAPMTVLEALSRGLLPTTATNDPYNLTAPVLAELSNGQQSHGAIDRGSLDEGTLDQFPGGLGGLG